PPPLSCPASPEPPVPPVPRTGGVTTARSGIPISTPSGPRCALGETDASASGSQAMSSLRDPPDGAPALPEPSSTIGGRPVGIAEASPGTYPLDAALPDAAVPDDPPDVAVPADPPDLALPRDPPGAHAVPARGVRSETA